MYITSEAIKKMMKKFGKQLEVLSLEGYSQNITTSMKEYVRTHYKQVNYHSYYRLF